MKALNASVAHIELPDRMHKLPISPKGFPVPWFVSWVDGVPDFRCVDASKVAVAHRQGRCWLCGERRGQYMAFVIGPMCAVNRVSSEPPSHRDCALYAVKACPFLTQPRMRRNKNDLPEEATNPAGIMIERNPGVTLLWITKSYRAFRAGNGALFEIGDPVSVEWFTHGRSATRAEIMEAIESGMPLLQKMADEESPRAQKALADQYARAMTLVPLELPS